MTVASLRPVPATVGIRMAALLVAVGMTLTDPVSRARIVWVLPLAAVVLARGAACSRSRPVNLPTFVDVGAEAVVGCLAVVFTGGLASGFILYVVVAVALTGFELGLEWSLGAAALFFGLVVLGNAAYERVAGSWTALVWALELTLAALTGHCARRRVTAAEVARRRAALDLERLATTNRLLADLCRAAGSEGMPVDVLACCRRAAATLHGLLGPDVTAIFSIPDLGPGSKAEVLLAEGLSVPSVLDPSELPPVARAAARAGADPVLTLVGPDEPSGGGLRSDSRTGLYAPLVAGGRLVGLLAVESSDRDRWNEDDVLVVGAVASQAALSIDNARRFARLCVTSLSEERERLAGELHDRTGQSVATVGLELDGIIRRVGDETLRSELASVRADVRAVLAELRGTLRDLRCEVSETLDMAAALALVAAHYSAGPVVEVSADASGRLPLLHERQLFLVAREAVASAVRAGATAVSITWSCDGARAQLEVSDDAPVPAAPAVRYADPAGRHPAAIETMRARCEALGGKLVVARADGQKTLVRCEL